jgi:hypothetical protein
VVVLVVVPAEERSEPAARVDFAEEAPRIVRLVLDWSFALDRPPAALVEPM